MDPLVLLILAKVLEKIWEVANPIQKLEKCIKDKEWFKGIVLSTAFFEGVGTIVLSTHFKGHIAPEKIEHIRSLDQIILLLYASEIIDQSTYSKMIEVNQFRNNLVHIKPFAIPQKIQPKKAKRIIKKAIVCLEALMEKWAETKRLEEPIELEEVK